MNTAFSIVSALALILTLPAVNAATKDQPSSKLTWAGCGVTKKAFMDELAKAYEHKTGVKINLEGGGATRGIREAANGGVDIGGSCRMTLPGEDRVELHANLHPVAWDALVIITHKSNTVVNLSTEQLQKIYLGKITNWSEVGGRDAPIHLYVRQGHISGVGYAIRQYLFKDSTIEFVTRPEFIMRSTGPLEEAIEKDVNGIGITGVSSARKRKVRLLNLDGKSPSYENVQFGKYTMYRPLYLVTAPSPTQEVKNFVSFAKSKEGRDVLRNNGTVPYLDAPHLMNKMEIYGFDVR